MLATLLVIVPYAMLYLSGICVGVALRNWWTQREAERFVARLFALEARDRRARTERLQVWHVEAESDADALELFHQRANIGELGGRA